MNFLYILLVGIVLLFFIAYIFSKKDILSPSVMMSNMFMVSTFFAVLNINSWNIDYSVEATLIVLSGITVFIFIEAISQFVFFNNASSEENDEINISNKFVLYPIKNWKLIFLIILNVITVIWYFFEIKSIVNISNIFAVFQEYRRIGISRVAGNDIETVGSILTQFLKIVEASGYVSSYMLIANRVGNSKNKKTNILLIILVVVSLLPSIFIASRTQILKLLSAILISFYILWHQKNGWHKSLSWKIIRIGFGSLFIGIPAFYYSLTILGRSTSRTIFDYASDYISSGIVLFSEYIKDPIARNIIGEESLYSIIKILNFLGISVQSTSYNLEFRPLGIGYSNVYTFFRRPLHDFGLIGMYVFVAIIALFFAWMYYGKIKGKPKNESTSYWTLIYGYFYYWIVSSSIIQYSTAYVSAGTIMILFVIVFIYRFLSEENKRIVFKYR